jgi:RHS repeat-associated protein
VVSYLASDGLGSATVTLNSSGNATAAQLFAPYGGVRYASGAMPTTYGFTGQRSDSASGLDYYGSRYYDPLAGQFTSGDSMMPGGGFDLWGLSRYAYVEGNPEDRTDPTGHINLSVGDDGSAVPIDSAFSGSYSWGSSPVVTYTAASPGRTRPRGLAPSAGRHHAGYHPAARTTRAQSRALVLARNRSTAVTASRSERSRSGPARLVDADCHSVGPVAGVEAVSVARWAGCWPCLGAVALPARPIPKSARTSRRMPQKPVLAGAHRGPSQTTPACKV